ncbi:MAG: DNA topoisomerase IB [Gemmatimonadaceae bacterium]|nr:DNA topoisomerase IB [Gemmatimonadaceae bacterium]NUQ94375.1 DNA topoisomerase IB [Gemmatimonadaceae bacterium]NUR19420.1 DNA topoisomerase IB [Gemmatimonadaceae bacterium]NUS97002.1 DNA topoisomerase IB [Gemmatimonadaceae bacterium]
MSKATRERWILRKGSPANGFRYETEGGGRVRDAKTLARIDKLRVPPAWRDVHLAAAARSSIQAWGFDARGRKQYRYHETATRRGELRKYYRVRQLGRDLPRIRRVLAEHERRRGATLERVAAGVLRLIAERCFRPGSDRYVKENRSFGITTLRKSHVFVDGDSVVFAFRGKSGVKQRQIVVDREIARFVRVLRETPGTRLFRYEKDGEWHDLDARTLNEYLRDSLGFPYTAKDFRTWGGTLRAATVLAEIGPPRSTTDAKRNIATVMRLVAAELGNTPTICRKSYVHPVIVERYLEDGETIAGRLRPSNGNGRGAVHTAEERALVRFLDEHFPERRRRRRVEV